jgi:hypothetical protein
MWNLRHVELSVQSVQKFAGEEGLSLGIMTFREWLTESSGKKVRNRRESLEEL